MLSEAPAAVRQHGAVRIVAKDAATCDLPANIEFFRRGLGFAPDGPRKPKLLECAFLCLKIDKP